MEGLATPQTLGSAAFFALAVTCIFSLAARAWQIASSSTRSRSHFPHSIRREAAHRLRFDVAAADRKSARQLATAIVFVLIFASALFLRPQGWFSGQPSWLYLLGTALASAVIVHGGWRYLSLCSYRRQLAFARDAHIAVGHTLQSLELDRRRVFHNVPCGDETIDNVVVGVTGVYAVHVLAEYRRKPGTAHCRNGSIVLSDSKSEVSVSLQRFDRKNALLAKELSKFTTEPVRVRSVVAIPGWAISTETCSNHLLVDERTAVMLQGWKDRKAYLLTDNVATLHKLLSERCTAAVGKHR